MDNPFYKSNPAGTDACRRGSPQLLIYDLTPKAFRARFALTPGGAGGVHSACAAGTARAPGAASPLVLKPSTSLREDIPAPARDQLPTYLVGRADLRAAPTWKP